MKLTIDTETLGKYNLSIGEFLSLLLGYYDVDIGSVEDQLKEKGLVLPNLFREGSIILSDNTKNLVSRIITESDPKLRESTIPFMAIADNMRQCYPSGVKSGTTYDWRGTIEEIIQKLRTLVVKYDFHFTEEEAVRATKEYVASFGKDYRHMKLLKYFILKTVKDSKGNAEIDSPFMTIIENNRA